ncbi:protein-methionine-sulfoxide reductase heme-binding subunit MsrQ (plasmid) [Roseomonas marmotae]|uniref:Protein-methionine-sulfoxide reductase heme-binding subunit MsrQ n=2 Tax=Roseomonas marmotae TaxID=2768161 RepID=A0ABS3KFW8_9PROT|nr:protein-methionine-sulfoxide reductase heme-binding subunit MsrQ [Roseomonas marmotae]QTI82029.1 protein-methionine-sulfoxide reductase heme-binding subunit MsrQ [Roseomonas marmotae]
MPLSHRINAATARIPSLACYLLGLLPLAWIVWLTVSNQLGADPARELEHRLGLWALRFLILGLCVTPLRRFADLSLLRYRRALGLLAFLYAVLHFATYLLLDQGLSWAAISADILKRYYITIGFAALLMLVPLAATSNRFSIRRLGPKWTRLHKLVYPAIALVAVHFVLSVKSWPAEPVIYAAIVAGLLLLRLVPRRRRAERRGRSARPATTLAPPA